jgi:hypothetical protein
MKFNPYNISWYRGARSGDSATRFGTNWSDSYSSGMSYAKLRLRTTGSGKLIRMKLKPSARIYKGDIRDITPQSDINKLQELTFGTKVKDRMELEKMQSDILRKSGYDIWLIGKDQIVVGNPKEINVLSEKEITPVIISKWGKVQPIPKTKKMAANKGNAPVKSVRINVSRKIGRGNN